MSILDFFDVYDYNHLMAWKNLSEKGIWPEGFIPEGTTFPHMWVVLITVRMSEAWVAQQLDIDKVDNMR